MNGEPVSEENHWVYDEISEKNNMSAEAYKDNQTTWELVRSLMEVYGRRGKNKSE